MNACRTCGMFGYSHLTGGWEGGQAEYVRVPFGMSVWSLKLKHYFWLSNNVCRCIYPSCSCASMTVHWVWGDPSGAFCWSSLNSTLKMISISFELNWNELLDIFFFFHRYEISPKLSFLFLFYYKLSSICLVIQPYCKTAFLSNFACFDTIVHFDLTMVFP